MDFPFIYGQIVSGSQFIDRKKELKKLKSNIVHGIHTALTAPRRWGKSSLIKQLSTKLAKTNKLKFIFIDLFRTSDEREFYEVFIKLVLQAASIDTADLGNILRKFLMTTQPKIKPAESSSDEFRFSLQWEDIENNYDEILELPEKLALKLKIKFIICVDEFQSMDKFKDPELFQSRLRSVWQHHAHVVYILCGCKPHLMEHIFNHQYSPFFGFAVVMHLQKIKQKHFISYIMSTYERSGKNIPRDRVKKMIKLGDHNPYILQQLARYIWLHSSEMVIESDIESALEEILMQNSVWYKKEVERMTPPQFNYLRAVVAKEKNLSSKEVIRAYKLGTSANVAKIKKVMEEREILDFWSPYPQFIDPFFKLWIKRQGNIT